ncbi:MAG: AAA family ATPase [Candidatus Limnocylindria bacterium]
MRVRGSFVGRIAEVAQIRAAIERSRSRPGATSTLLIGRPGSGKTRLVREALAVPSPSRVLTVTGYEPEQAVPLAAVRELVWDLAAVGPKGARLATLAFGDDGGHAAAPIRFFEAAYQALVGLAPAVVSLDDLQWVDELSLALVSYLVRAAEADRVSLSLIAAGRPSANAGVLHDSMTHVLPDAVDRTELELQPLPEEAGVALVQSLSPEKPPAEAASIWRAAAGSPFWIEAIAIEGAGGRDLTRRMRQLSGDAATALRSLAVVGRPAEAADLATLLRWPQERLGRAAAELMNRGLAMDRDGLVEIAHDLIRETAVRELPADSGRALHAGFAAQLRASADGDVRRLREALGHSRQAGEPVLDLAVALARAPQRRLLGIEGLRELAHIADAADPADPKRQELEVGLAELASELGERILELERWGVVADSPVPPLQRGQALLAAGRAAYRLGQRDAAYDLVTRARTLHLRDEALMIALDAQEAEILRWLEHRLPEARRLTTRALDRAERAVATTPIDHLDDRLRAAYLHALQAASDLALQEGNEIEQASFAERIVSVAKNEREGMEAKLLLASAYRRSGRVADAELLSRLVREQARERIYPALMVTAGHHLARALYNLGRLEEAERVAAETEELSRRIGETGRFLTEIRSLRPAIALSRGGWDAAIARLRQEAEQETDPHYRLGLQQEIAIWLSRLAGPSSADEVRSRLAAAEADAKEVGCPRCSRELGLKTAQVLARIGDIDAALRAIVGRTGAQSRHSIEARLYLRQALGAIAAARGRSRQAVAVLSRLSDRLVDSGMHREAMLADLDRAAALGPSDPSGAIGIYRSVAERAEVWGVSTDLDVARQRLRALGARTAPPRPRPGPWGLTARELEIARLAASGATNPEIAGTLFISRKTVERHLSATLAKVGARNRTELAARLAAAAEPDSQE